MFKKTLLLACLLPAWCLAQDPMRWGRLTDAEIRLAAVPYDTAADAVVLSDYGKIIIDYGNITIERHRRVKILSRKGLDRASVALAYFVKDKLEDIQGLDAQTLNADKAGKVTATEVARKDVFDVEVNADWREIRFGFPAVQVGSVLEYRYRTVSRNYTFPDGWEFQSDMPTLHSETSAQIRVQHMDYRVVLQGNRLSDKYKAENGKTMPGWALDNLPALTDEPFVANKNDYVEKLRFQLVGYQQENSLGQPQYKSILDTWEKLAGDVQDSPQYFPYMNGGGKARDLLAGLLAPADAEADKLGKIYRFVKARWHWNGKHRVFPEQPLARLLETRQGSSAEINLLLVRLLQEAGLAARPLLLSTRSNGRAQQQYPLLSQFNHVAAHVRLGEKNLVLDATDPLRPHALPAEDDLAGAGLVLDRKQTRWVDIDTPPGKEIVYAAVDLSGNKLAAKVSVRHEGYKALEHRRLFASLGEQKYLEHCRQLSGMAKVAKFEQKALDTPDEPLVQQFELVSDDDGAQAQTLYLQPVVWNTLSENPYKGTVRHLPVELDYPESRQFVLTLTLPEGYQVVDSPKPLLISLPGDMGSYRYQMALKDGQLQLYSLLQIKSTRIPAGYYSHLAQFYDQVVAKQKEMVVLKKAAGK